jgi:hypothetical protein
MDDIVGGVITPLIEVNIPKKKVFMPWHKPRKHWCRFNQWYAGMNWVIDKVGPDELSCFNYLGLPGDDLLDLRLFADGCKNKNVQLKYLGFNSVGDKVDSSTELNISESELNMTGVIVSGSKVITEPLETLSRKESSSFSDVISFRGFHMINFDLCKSIAKKDASFNGDTYFKALKNLLEQQLNYMRQPWTLYVTTVVSKEAVIDGAMLPLLEAVKDNYESHAEFLSCLEERILITPEIVEAAIENISTLSEADFFDCFSIGFSKWLLKMTMSIQGWSIIMTDSCKYKAGDAVSEPNMLSVGFRFEYVHQDITDPYNVADLIAPVSIGTELDFALQMLDQVEELFNLDQFLKNDKSLDEKLISYSADLLEHARYDRNEYLDWVKIGCPSNLQGT